MVGSRKGSIEQISSHMGGISPCNDINVEKSRMACYERLFLLHWNYNKKIIEWIFYHSLVVFTHCGYTTVFKQLIKVSFALQNSSVHSLVRVSLNDNELLLTPPLFSVGY